MRCYDGCPDKELQAFIDAEAKAHRELAKLGLRATYFPMEGAWMAFRDHVSVTGFCNTVRGCLEETKL